MLNSGHNTSIKERTEKALWKIEMEVRHFQLVTSFRDWKRIPYFKFKHIYSLDQINYELPYILYWNSI